MPQSTSAKRKVTACLDAPAHQEDASNTQDWEPGLRPSRPRGYSLASGQRHTRAMLPKRELGVNHKLNLPAWQKPYAEALLATENQASLKLLATAEIAFFARLLELADKDASEEREDISRAIDVVLNLKFKAQASSRISTGL
jgi:hypothetical protein